MLNDSSSASPAAVYPDLRGRTVFITGGASGIGAALVEAFAAQGARVAFVDIDDTASQLLVGRLQSAGYQSPWWRRCDVRDIGELQRAIEASSAALGDIQVLVNNVASDDRHELKDVTPEYWEQRMAINLRPAFFAIQAVAPGMNRRGGGSIINLGSTFWRTKASGYPCYAVAKSAVNGMTRGLARTLGAQRIRINTVSPGWVMTDRQKKLWLDADGERELDRNQCLPLRIQPGDVANMVLFLASDVAACCTAQEYVVDAGWS